MRKLPVIRCALLVVVLAFTLTGCGFSLYNMPLPGGADVGSNPITITADFADVNDLVPQSSVKVENIAVGRVSKIDLGPDDQTARVTMVIRGNLKLPANTTARLQQTTLLGEKYIALVRPKAAKASTAVLHDGSHIALTGTSDVAQVEQVLGALSAVINGGGIGKFKEISRELSKISSGRPGEIRGFLNSTRAFVSGLDRRKHAIAAALDSLDDLSKTLNGQKDQIAKALDGLSPGMKVLAEQRPQLVAMLKSLDRLSGVTVRTLEKSQKNTVEDLKLLEPVLDNLAKAGADLPGSLQMLLTYPFPDAVLDGAIKGDYLNVFVTTNYSSLPPGCKKMGCPWPQPGFAISGSSGRIRGMPHTRLATAVQGTKDMADTEQSTQTGATSTATPTQTPSPTLLPPTDSAVPGSQPTVRVPTSSISPSTTGSASSNPSASPSSTQGAN